MATKKTTPSWSDVKTTLTDFDRAGLIGLVQDLYAANKGNQTFLHTRFGLGGDVLKPYKTIIERWLWPDLSNNLDTSITKAKKAIADYKKASGQPEGLTELMVFYCEQGAGFCNDIALQDEGYFDALVLMFEHTLKQLQNLPPEQRNAFGVRLVAACRLCRDLGYGVYDEVRDMLAEHGYTS